jgi:hypothetical protein
MKNGRIARPLFLQAAIFVWCVHCCYAQTVTVTADRQDILIGEQFRYTVKAVYPTGAFNVRWLNIPDSIEHFEVIERSKVDSSFAGANAVLQQIITFTSFDSGRWSIPSFMLQFDGTITGGANKKVKTDTLSMNVGFAKGDTTNQLRDIKPIVDTEEGVDWQLYLLIAASVLVAVFLGWQLIRYLRGRQTKTVKNVARLSAYHNAVKALEQLGLPAEGDAPAIKAFHDRLGHIFRTYVADSRQVNALSATTGELLSYLHGPLPKDDVSILAGALRCGDAVKFARYEPPVEMHADCKRIIKVAMDVMEKIKSEPDAV